MRLSYELALFIGMASAAVTTYPTMDEKLYKRVPGMIFDCAHMPDICTNMCWGAYCTDPSFGATLYYDKASKKTKRARRTSAGCQPRPNRCSEKHKPPYPKAKYNCDEYPFASTSDADKGGQVNRCVPKKQNSAQGGVINKYYHGTCGSSPCQFIITFGNPAAAGVKYCEAYNNPYNQCIPDGNEFKGQTEDVRPPPPPARKRGEPAPKRTGGLYVTESGMEISSSEDLEPGTLLMRAPTTNGTVVSHDLDEGDGYEWDSPDSDPGAPVMEIIRRKIR